MKARDIAKLAARFDALSLRERVLLAACALAAVLMFWTLSVFDPLTAKEQALGAEMTSLQESMKGAAQTLEMDINANPVRVALEQERKLKAELEAVNVELASKAAGLIPPERMVEVIHDVLSRQRGVALVTLHNKPVRTLAPQAAAPEQGESTGPYVHPVELVIEGGYLDVLGYLRALEQLPWRFYWTRLELTSTAYPTNRVRIELSTLSMDKHWIGV